MVWAMKGDLGGAAVVTGTILAAAKRGAKINVVVLSALVPVRAQRLSALLTKAQPTVPKGYSGRGFALWMNTCVVTSSEKPGGFLKILF